VPELIGEEHIDWENFTVTDPDAPEYEAPTDATEDDDQGTPDDVGDGVDEPIAAEDTPEAAAPLEQEAGDEPVEESPRLYAGKYRTVEEMEAAFEHQQTLAGRQGTELGEMRQQMAELLEAVNRPPAPDLGNLEDVFMEDPMEAADRALAYGSRTGDYSAHHAVISQWREIDAAQVRLYENQKRIEAQLAASNARVEQLPAQLQQPQRYQDALEAAHARLQSEFPDIDLKKLEPAMIEEAVEARRISGDDDLYTKLMESGDPDKTYQGLRTLALTALTRSSAESRQQVVERARAAAVETQRAKVEAMVTSGSSTGADPAPPKSYDDQLLEEFEAQDKRADGFRIGNY
jgi:hypothetical protein